MDGGEGEDGLSSTEARLPEREVLWGTALGLGVKLWGVCEEAGGMPQRNLGKRNRRTVEKVSDLGRSCMPSVPVEPASTSIRTSRCQGHMI